MCSGDYAGVGTRVSTSIGDIGGLASGIGGLVLKFTQDILVTHHGVEIGVEIGFLPLSTDSPLLRLNASSCDIGDTSSKPSSTTTVCDFLFLEVKASMGRIFLFMVLGIDVEAKAS